MKRQRPAEETRRELSRFYGGLGCVVTGRPERKASLHHLNGNPAQSRLENLLPLSLDLHNRLRVGLPCEDLRPELRAENLKMVAEDHFISGDCPKAFGCLRLAHSLSAHFHKPTDRDLEAEFQLLAQSLYFLRRSIGQSPLEIVYENLQWVVEVELETALQSRNLIPPFGSFWILVELGSWLNELGRAKEGARLLSIGLARLKTFQNGVTPGEKSRFLRQIAVAYVQIGHQGAEMETALRMAMDGGDSNENNKLAIANIRLLRLLGEQNPKHALSLLKDRFEHYESQTDYFFGPLTRLGPTIMTTLGFIALSLICEGQLIRTKVEAKKLEARLEALKFQEQRYQRATMLNQVSGLDEALSKAAAKVRGVDLLFEKHGFPTLPSRLANTILSVASKL